MRADVPEAIELLACEAARALRTALPPEARIYWFGSWVKGTAVPRSDLDLAVDAGSALSLRRFRELRDLLEEMPTLYSFDLMDLRAVSDERRDGILAYAVEL